MLLPPRISLLHVREIPHTYIYSYKLLYLLCIYYPSGLYARFTNDVGRAISELNLARKDEQWGPVALTHMVELYLNPDQEGVWEEKEGVSIS